MASHGHSQAHPATGSVGAAGVMSGKQTPQLKHSPSLLFDILTESDKTKQQLKLQGAARLGLGTTSMPLHPSCSPSCSHPQQQQQRQLARQSAQPNHQQHHQQHQRHLRQEHLQQQQASGTLPTVFEAVASTTASATGLAAAAPTAHSSASLTPAPAPANPPGAVSPLTPPRTPDLSCEGAPHPPAAAAPAAPAPAPPITPTPATALHSSHSSTTRKQEGSSSGGNGGRAFPGEVEVEAFVAGSATAATGGAAAAAVSGAGAAAGEGGGGGSGGGGGAEAEGGGGAEAEAEAEGDPLAEFTPRVILQELLGQLFIPPERLTPQGTFGQGAFATVQSCSLDDPLGGPRQLVAVKRLQPHVLADLGDLRSFLLEANLIRKLKHPHIVSLRGLGAAELSSLECVRRSAYVVMEALEGGDLRMMVLRQMTCHSPAYSRLDALRWCAHIASAGAYLHHTCRPLVIHRDLKLENVLLSGGPADRRVAKITDFGLHKRARYSRAEDVLIAVTNEWSVRAGSVYRQQPQQQQPQAGGGYPGAHAGDRSGSGRHADRSVYDGGAGGRDVSYYGGSVHAGNMFTAGGPSCHPGSTSHHHPSHHHHPAPHSNRSTSAHYAALAAAGMAAATAAEANADRTVGRSRGGGAAASALAAAAAATEAGLNSIDNLSSLGIADTSVRKGVAGGGGGGGGGQAPDGGASAASTAPVRIAHGSGFGAGLSERERPYLLAYDKRYHLMSSKVNSFNDLATLHETATLSGAATPRSAATAATADSSVSAAAASPAPPSYTHPSSPGLVRPASGWAPPHVVPLASAEESVHRKMLALMALEAAAAAGPAAAAAPVSSGSGHGGGGGDRAAAGGGGAVCGSGTAEAGPGGGGEDGREVPFSVTEYVRAATATAADATGGDRPSAVMIMRSMNLALQQQQQSQQQQLQDPHTGDRSYRGGGGGGGGAAPAAARAAAGLSGCPPHMKTVPEHTRMSMDVGVYGGGSGSVAAKPAAAAAAAVASHGGDGGGGGGQPDAARQAVGGSQSRSRQEGAAAGVKGQREAFVSAAGRLADATRQVGSLIYMAPELVLSGNYNEKVDVFSFAIMAYELFTGKLLAIKVAHDHAFRQMQSQSQARQPPPGPQSGGPLPAAGSPSSEASAEAGVMSYVMRRSCQGEREPLPGWWPGELRQLLGRCWAHDPRERPSFREIHSELQRLQAEGALADMDARDPARAPGCGCTVS